ncbi:MAG: hypothetical protein HKP30_17005 [Myxococcales bacterium]|nr:hypothetical protein [Myxococcales bacterium]
MGKLMFLALLLGGGWYAWENDWIPVPDELKAPSPAFATYARFSEYLAHDHYGNARKLAAKGAVRSVKVRELRGRRNTKLGISGRALSKDDQKLLKLGEVIGVSHDVISEIESSDGSRVAIQAVQRVCRDRSGCQETRHEVEVCRSESEWKVCSFRESNV